MLEADVTPDHPVAFGGKNRWLVIRSRDALEVLDALSLVDVRISNWKAGINAAYGDNGDVFVSPPVNQWVFVVGWGLPFDGGERRTDLLLRLGQRFEDVQYFGNHRVSSYYAWARVINGEIIRQYSWHDHEVSLDSGAETPEEIALEMYYRSPEEMTEEETAYWESDEDDEAFEAAFEEKFRIPGAEDVFNLAGAWSINPTTLEDQNLPSGTGYLGRFPETGSL